MVEDQVTYPLTTAMLAVPKSKVVRGFSFFGASFVYVIFEDGTDIYWARSRVLEYLNFAAGRLPKGVTPPLGPDATGVGWVYQYALLGDEQERWPSCARSRTGTCATSSPRRRAWPRSPAIGGFVQQYQVIGRSASSCAPTAFRWPRSSQVIRDSNRDVGGRVVEMAETEYMVRGRATCAASATSRRWWSRATGGTPVLIRDVARVEMAAGRAARPDRTERRGRSRLRHRDGALRPERARGHRNLKAKIAEVAAGLPEGVTIVAVYDRSDLIHRAIETLKRTLLEESVIVAAVCIVFLLHVRSALVAILMLPVGVLIAFIAMRLLGHELEHHEPGRHRDRHRRDGRRGDRHDRERAQAPRARCSRMHAARGVPTRCIDACKEVGPALFFSLLIITVSFLPVFTLEAQEGRLFSPLAYTKTFSMAGAALLSVTLVPVLMMLFIRGRIMPEAKNPVNRFLIWVYRPIIAWVMRWKKLDHRARAGRCWP